MQKFSISQIIISIVFVWIIGFIYIATAFTAIGAFARKDTQSPGKIETVGSRIDKTVDVQPPSPTASGMNHSFIKHAIDTLYTYRDNIDQKSSEKIWGKYTFIDIFGLIQRAIGRQFIQIRRFEIFKDSDSKLDIADIVGNTAISDTYIQDLDQLSHNLMAFKKRTDELNIPLLFIIVPPRIFKGYTRLPIGIDNPPTDEHCIIIDLLKRLKIEFIDLEKEIFGDKIPLDTIFYKTDHHWTIQTSFWAYTKIFNRLSNEYGFTFDPKYAKVSNFNSVDFKDGFLGSIGNRVGKYYVGVDDFTYLEPKFETDFTVTKQDYNYQTKSISGPFSDSILDKNMLRKKNNSEPVNRYAVYHGGDWPQEFIVNHNQYKHKVLIIKDSFALPVAAFLALNVHQLEMIDLRWYKQDMSVTDLVKNFLPDIILFIYKPSSLFDKNHRSELVFNLN
jgi:hypothetical protein